MTSIVTPESSRTTEATSPPGRRVIDAPVRTLHWLLALCFVLAFVSGDSEQWRYLHITAGYTICGLLAFRLLYGLVGPRQARLSVYARRLAGLPAWWRRVRAGNTDQRQAGNLAAVTAIVGIVTLLPLAITSGVATHFEWTGDWMEDVHEFTANTALLLVLAHLVIIAAVSLQRGQNLARPMVTGRSHAPGADLAGNHKILAVLIFAATLTFWGWSWQQAPSAEGATAWSERNEDHHDHND